MFETDIKRINACLAYRDYYSALQYAILVKDRYVQREKEFFDKIIKSVKNGCIKIKLD